MEEQKRNQVINIKVNTIVYFFIFLPNKNIHFKFTKYQENDTINI